MGILQLIEGAAEVAVGLATGFGPLVSLGIGTTISAVGSLISPPQVQGKAITERNSIGPWRYGYGRTAPKTDTIYMHQWGASGQMLDLVMVVYDCPVQSIDEVLFDQQRIQIDTAAIPTTARAGYAIPAPAAGSGTSFTPVQQTNIVATSITQFNDVVTIKLPQDVPYLTSGDPLIVKGTSGNTYNATFPVAQILGRGGAFGALSFTIINGATMPGTVQVSTKWVDYGRTVYFEPLLGNQLLGQTFVGMTAGTPWQGTGKLCTPLSPQNAGTDNEFPAQANPWTPNCSGQGKALVFLRIQVGDPKFYPSGLPLISFRCHGKNDIYDPRLGACTGVKAVGLSGAGSAYQIPALYGTYDTLTLVQAGASGGQVAVTGVDGSGHITSYQVVAPGSGYALGACTTTGGHGTGATFTITALTGATGCNVYTENPALCIADYLAMDASIGGYGCAYGSEIPTAALTTAANVCDTSTALARGGTEPLYACNGQWDLSRLKGEVLSDLLTSCAGRITPEAPYTIQPGYWTGTTASATDLQAIAVGAGYRWKGPTIHELYNACAGTYISPDNKWQSTDFPRYAQDGDHGYSGPSIYAGDINMGADGGQRRTVQLNQPFCISSRQAQYAAKVEMLRRRWANLGIPPVSGTLSGFGGMGEFTCHMAAYEFAVLDVFAGTVGFLGLSGQAMEVTLSRLKGEVRDNAMLMSVDLEVRLTDSSIYAWSTSEELTPQGYVQTQWPVGFATEIQPYPWAPGYVAPLAGDAYYPQGATGPASFGLQPSYGIDAQGNSTAQALISGTVPANVLDAAIEAPQFICVASTTGGGLAPGDYVIAVSARDSGASVPNNSEYQAVAVVTVAGSGAGSIGVSITWGSGDDGGDIFVGRWNVNGYVLHHNQVLTPGQATATVTTLDESTYGGPDPIFDHFGIVWQQEIHGGPWAQQVQAVTSTTVTIAGAGMTANQWAGRALSLLAKYDPTAQVPILNMPVASNTASSGTPAEFVLTIGPNSASVQLPDLTTLLAVGDLVVMRPHYTFTAQSMADLLIANPYYPTGANATVEPGHVAVCMTGANAGDRRTISSVTADINGHYTIFNLASPWAITPATGDLVIICAPSQQEIPGNGWTNANNTLAGLVASPDVTNLGGQAWLLLMRTEDIGGNYGPDVMAPMREIFFFGGGGMSSTTVA